MCVAVGAKCVFTRIDEAVKCSKCRTVASKWPGAPPEDGGLTAGTGEHGPRIALPWGGEKHDRGA